MGEIRIKRDVSDAIVYGIHIDPNISDPSNAVTYLEDAVGMTPASMGSTTFNSGSWADAFFMPKPCMVRYDGTVDYYLDPSDYSKKADGTASDIADPNYGGNAMMEWGLIWFKFEPGEADGEGYFYVSNKKVNDSFNCWCNYDANNNITQHFYTAIYNGTGTDKLRSISGVQLTSRNGSGNTPAQQEITRAMANNTSDMTEWYIDLWADEVLATGLLYLVGKSLNLQAMFGRGLDSGGYTAKNAYVTGTLNDKGLFWGDTTSGNHAVKVFGMENRWGCYWHRIAGLFGTPTGYAYKLTHGTVDGSTATEFGTNANGYIPVTATQPENGPVRKMLFGKQGMLPSAVGGSTSTYYCDYFIKGNNFAMVGGNTNYGLYCGFYVALHQSADNSDWSISTSLSLKPQAKTPYNPDWDNRPAHKFTNGQWVDIPTHHYTNGRWQGELTSQSPLKFRADGEMLDWRVEGKTSGNLFDGELEQGSLNSNDGSEVVNNTRVRTMENTLLKEGTYTIDCVGATGGVVICAYNTDDLSYDKNASYVGQWRALPFTFIVNDEKLFRFAFKKAGDSAISPSEITNIQLLEGTYTTSTIPPYEPYGGVGDWDETAKKYRIPVRVEGENLYVGELEQGSLGTSAGQEYPTTTRVRTKKPGVNLQAGTYTIDCVGATGGVVVYVYNKDSSWDKESSSKNWQAMPLTFSLSSEKLVRFAFRKTGDSDILPSEVTDIRLYEGTYTASTLPPYEVNLFTDHQLMDGDSIDFATDQTAIPIATGNNTLTVDTAVKPKSIFVKFEG